MNTKYQILIITSFIIVLLDQVSKNWVHTVFQWGESVTIIPNWFSLTYVRNPGAAFGFLADANPAFRDIFFLSVPPIALIIILILLRGVKKNDILSILALSFVFAGAIGNYIDRIRFGFVIDFLDFYFTSSEGVRYAWPAFNVADMAIVGGVGALLYVEFFRKDTPTEKPKEASETG